MGFVHGDFRTRNWLWAAASDQVAVIDYETADVGFAVEDLAWLFAVMWGPRPDLRDAFLAGYGREPSRAERQMLAAVTVLAALQHIADGVRLGLAVKVTNGPGGLRRAGLGLRT